ncbi:hypothetical protein B0J11DRAFT_519681 [Dendryphion nanum]|uniref:Uncharacterized protein n=1 Tax=Dendryphion nanum TaxID=256645 RepID=A0A9P9IXM2_9PLEO|nr:hypothetical protein B0J11DRAFT_519681 [Dendryphion nanum]
MCMRVCVCVRVCACVCVHTRNYISMVCVCFNTPSHSCGISPPTLIPPFIAGPFSQDAQPATPVPLVGVRHGGTSGTCVCVCVCVCAPPQGCGMDWRRQTWTDRQ